mmetsp:Transcript_26787/g.58105  ORF Transcript_26787/g.58105 Transcript_26787/m.58105 type:complete len:620 (+) Transcript_26787:173-2032(+)|eukprot:CAMPEP_0178624648 /NCGR_PEP_ID=MMETSP0698-20121128/7464_1 /TAXON_ID=265572 /ORGANISM="Extubocellulus spinifer, Strain CCMP396" /LENGTH=619 /DNA_ID=CAMNT_0020263773 /DNA_START=78 /DNA_END=1937 /DNA_ORIENTATION=+
MAVLKYLLPICILVAGFRILGVAIRIFSTRSTSNKDLRLLALAGIPLQELLHAAAVDSPDADRHCPFRNSSIYRSIYVYPTFNGTFGGDWTSDPMVLSRYGKPKGANGTASPLKPWPWIGYDETERKRGIGKYDLSNLLMQSYSLELVVRDVITHPDSCLRTDDPEKAKLFYIPYLPSAEYHEEGVLLPRGCEKAFGTSPYAQAIIDAIDGNYDGWEKMFGLTSKYWKRRNGSDHILVHSEAMHGLRHHIKERGHYAYIYNQLQLKPPISISHGVPKTFFGLHPKCAAKNILVPYPNPDGRWFNGQHARAAAEWRNKHNLTDPTDSEVALEAEAIIAREGGGLGGSPRAVAFHYHAGIHGSCRQIRETLANDLKCTRAVAFWNDTMSNSVHTEDIIAGFQSIIIQMHSSTFSFAPAGDTPGSKRMFDVTFARSIPVILSDEFVWPFSTEVDSDEWSWDPADFAVRLNVSDYLVPRYDSQCKKVNGARSFQEVIGQFSPDDIRRLRRGVEAAALRYSFYSHARIGESANLLQDRILPDGGAAHALVDALANRAKGVRWSDCEKELKMPPKGGDPNAFGCTSPETKNLPQLQDQSEKYRLLCSRRRRFTVVSTSTSTHRIT